MKRRRISRIVGLAIVIAGTSGCAAYRVSSNIDTVATPSAQAAHIIITEGSLSDRTFRVLGPVEVSVKKLTLFHKDPTKEQADEALAEKARAIGADAVIDVTYTSGIGLTTWGYIDAKGTAIKLTQ